MGISSIGLTKLDVLDAFETIQICTAYDATGAAPVYEEYPGWSCSTATVRKFEDLPKPAQDYVQVIEEYTGVPVDLISTGSGRDDVIIRKPLFQ